MVILRNDQLLGWRLCQGSIKGEGQEGRGSGGKFFCSGFALPSYANILDRALVARCVRISL